MSTIPPGIELAIMFPPSEGRRGACTTIADLDLLRWHFGMTTGRKWYAVHLIMRHAFDCYASAGHGNKAAKREGMLSTMSDQRLAESMQVRDNQMHADLCYDRGSESRSYPTKPNHHDV